MNGEEIQKAVQKAMRMHPTGLVVVPMKTNLSAVFWTDKEISPGIMYDNLIGGIATQAIEGGLTTKKDLMAYLDKLLKESH